MRKAQPRVCEASLDSVRQAKRASSLGMLRRAVAPQERGRRDAAAAVVGQAQAHQRRIGHVAHAHRAIEAFAGHVDQPVAEVQRDRDLGMQLMKARHQRRHVPAAEAGRGRHAQMAAGLDAAGAHAGFGIGELDQQALAVLEKGAAFVRERDAPRGAHQQLDAEPLFQRIEPPAHDRGRHAFRLGGRRQAAARGHGNEGFKLFESVHRERNDAPAGARRHPLNSD